jgi:hypothetical protein
MTKFILPILLILVYLTTSSIILSPVTFADETEEAEPIEPLDFTITDNTEG